MPVPSQEYDSCLPVAPIVDMVELPFGFVIVCELSLLFIPWSAVHLLLALSRTTYDLTHLVLTAKVQIQTFC